MTDEKIVMKAGEIVAAYVSHNSMPPENVPVFLETLTHEMVRLIGVEETPPQPAVPIEESYGDDFIICLEDGARVTLLKRYLAKYHNMTPEEYLEKWGLPEDYPMVTPEYSRRRSSIAKDNGLGRN
jgi:predicted transcriptional regulator